MKNFQILLLLLTTSLVSCNEDNGGESIPLIYNYINVVDDRGNDVIQNDSIYSIKNFLVSPNGLARNDIYDSVNIEGKTILAISFYGSSKNLLQFNDIDYDTLEMISEPSSVVFGKIDKITYYYNGEEMETLDFIANPELKQEIEERNTQYIERETTNPFYVTLVKK